MELCSRNPNILERVLNWTTLSSSTVGKCAPMQVIKQPERGRTSTTEEKKYLPFKQNFVPVDNFNTNNKNDSPNKLIIVKKSR